MSEVTLATLAMEVSVPTADAAIDKLTKLRKAASDLEGQAGKTAAASKEQASAHGYAGTAAAQAEKSMRDLAEVYGVARDRLGRFTKEDGSFRASQEATALMLIRNAQATAALAKEQQAAAAQVARLTASYDPLAGAVMRTNNEIAKADALFKSGKLSAEQYATIVGGLKGKIDLLESAQTGLNKTGNTLRYTTLNLGRQFADIGTQLAGGQSPFLILVQQGPQIADAFATATAGGLTFKAVIAGLVTEAKALLLTFGPWIAGLAAVGGAVWYLVDAHNKQKKAIEDLNAQLTKQRDELSQISPFLFQTGDNANLAAEGQRNFDAWLRKTNVSLAEQNRLLRENALNELNKKALDVAENLRKAQEQFDKVNKPGPRMASAGGAGGFGVVAPVQSTDPKSNPFWKEAKANLDMAKASSEAIGQYLAKMAQAPDTAFASGAGRTAKAIREVKAATDDYLRAAPILESSLVKAANEVWPEAAAAAEAYKKQQDALKAAANDNIRTFDEQTRGTIRFSSTLEKMAYDLEDAAAMSRGLRYDIEDIAYAINNNDWVSAFAGLVNVLAKVDQAFKSAKDSKDKFAAVAMLAQGVGSAVGGTGGAVVGGAGSGALAGLGLASSLTTLGLAVPGPGWALAAGGAVLGAIGGLFGSSKAKKQRRAQEAAQRAAEEAQRQQTIADTQFGLDVAILRAQGKEQEALTKERDKEIARLQALSPALVDSQKQLWALEDAATAAAAAAEKAAAIEAKRQSIQDQIDKLTLSDSELLAKTRAKERAEAVALDPALGDLIDKLYGLQDSATAQASANQALAEAASAATTAAERQAQAMQSLGDSFGNALRNAEELSKSLQSFADSLLNELGLGGQQQNYAASRAAFLSNAQIGNFDQGLAQAFLDASKATATSSSAYQSDVALVRGLALGKVADLSDYPARLARLFQAIQADAQAKATGFATGGSFEVGGSGPPDSKLFNLALSPGEMVNVTRPGANDNSTADLVAEVRALRQEVASLRASSASTARSNDKIESYLRNVTEGGRAMFTEAAS